MNETVPGDLAHLGRYSGWPRVSRGPRSRAMRPDPAMVRALVEELIIEPAPGVMAAAAGATPGHRLGQALPKEVRTEETWQADGLSGEEISYSVGYGPRTRAWLLKPVGTTGPLPCVLALHSHDGFKYYGKEKIADREHGPLRALERLRAGAYGGRAYANELARRGFVVLVPDTFCWGSRRFLLEEMPAAVLEAAEALGRLRRGEPARRQPDSSGDDEIDLYNFAAAQHEHVVEKYCSLLGTTMAAVVAHEDTLALRYLLSRPDTTERAGCIGLSGGGCRSALLRAVSSELTASVITGMMSTYDGLLDHNVVSHTWMFMPAGFAARADWPDLAACRAPLPLLVQYNREDPLFTVEGARAAHERIESHYAAAGAPAAYSGVFYDGPHKFDLQMQEDAFDWLESQLSGGTRHQPDGRDRRADRPQL